MPDDALGNVKMDQLDQVIDAILAGRQVSTTDPEVAALAEIAASLRDLPDEGFQKRLKSELQRRASVTASAAAATFVPEGYHTVTPYIAVPDGARLIEFLEKTFEAEESFRHSYPGGFHAEVRIGDSVLIIGADEAVRGHEKIGAFHVYVPDCDAVYNRAIEAGATSMGAPSDHHYGERAGYVKDPSGNQWYIATHLGPTPALESLWTVTPFVHPISAAKYIDFLTKALGAKQLALYEDSGRVPYAAVQIGDAVVEMGEPHDASQTLPGKFYMYVEDCDAAYQQAIAAGATPISPPSDKSYGDRNATVADPSGYQWFLATQIKNV